jgi:hypothetical protein
MLAPVSQYQHGARSSSLIRKHSQQHGRALPMLVAQATAPAQLCCWLLEVSGRNNWEVACLVADALHSAKVRAAHGNVGSQGGVGLRRQRSGSSEQSVGCGRCFPGQNRHDFGSIRILDILTSGANQLDCGCTHKGGSSDQMW